MELRYHPLFERCLAALAEGDEEIFGEVMALLTALEIHGRELDDEQCEESHPLSPLGSTCMRSGAPHLRKQRPTQRHRPCSASSTRSARLPPGDEVAVALLGGDKTVLGNNWYPANLAEAEHRLEQYGRQEPDLTPIVKRGNR